MSEGTIFFILLISGFLASGVLAFLCLRYYLRLRYTRRRLRLAETRLGEYRRRLLAMRGRLTGGRGFSGAVVSEVGRRAVETVDDKFPPADLRVRLQQGLQHSSGAVERYRLVVSMARRGLSADDISEILQLPAGETEQLLKLSQVGRAGG